MTSVRYENPRLIFRNEAAPQAEPRRDLPGYEITRSEAIFSDDGTATVHIWFAPIPAVPDIRQVAAPPWWED